MTPDRTAPAAEPHRPGVMRRVGGALIGVVALLLGAFLVLRPFSSLRVLVLSIAVALVVWAASDLGAHYGAGGARRLRAVIGGCVRVAAALALLLWPAAGLGVIVLLAALSLAGNGILDGIAGFQQRGARRWTLLFLGAASVLVALLAFAWPDLALLVMATAFGVRLIVLGFGALSRALRPARGRAESPTWLQLSGSVLALVGALVLVGVSLLLGRAFPEPDAFYSVPPTLPAEPGRLLRSEPFERQVPEGARAWRILYTTTLADGAPAVASGIVVAPSGSAVAAGNAENAVNTSNPESATTATPLVAWAHGTTGWASRCAPSLLEQPFESGALFVLDQVVANGWSLVATDYTGLGTPGPHPYLVGDPTARSVLDSVRAARELLGGGAGDETVVWGHSQGGHAALWTGALAAEYAPELGVVGVAALAPAANLPDLVEVVGAITGGSLFAAYVAQAYTAIYPDVSFDRYIRPGARLIVREMAHRCLSEPSSLVSLAGALVLDQPIWGEEPTTGPLAERLRQNTPTEAVATPLLVMQGEADTLIRPEAQAAYVEARCAAGDLVDYRTYEDRDHLALVTADSPAMSELFEWTRARFAGEPAGTAGCELE